jgi:hypothetical protein
MFGSVGEGDVGRVVLRRAMRPLRVKTGWRRRAVFYQHEVFLNTNCSR